MSQIPHKWLVITYNNKFCLTQQNLNENVGHLRYYCLFRKNKHNSLTIQQTIELERTLPYIVS